MCVLVCSCGAWDLGFVIRGWVLEGAGGEGGGGRRYDTVSHMLRRVRRN